MLYTSGISKLTELKADDKVGIMFCLVIALIQMESHELILSESNLTENQLNDILYVLELMLCYWAWLKMDTYWALNDAEAFHKVQQAIEMLLREIIEPYSKNHRQRMGDC